MAKMPGSAAFRGPACEFASRGCTCYRKCGPHAWPLQKRTAKRADRRAAVREAADGLRGWAAGRGAVDGSGDGE